MIEDCGRNGDMTLGVTKPNGAIAILDYSRADMKGDKLTASFWRRHGYVGRLIINDQELDVTYTTIVTA